MPNKEHLDLLKQGVKAWNIWRSENKAVTLKLMGADLSGVNFRRADLRGVDFSEANLINAKLEKADLRECLFRGTKLSGIDLRGAGLEGTDLSGSYLRTGLCQVFFLPQKII